MCVCACARVCQVFEKHAKMTLGMLGNVLPLNYIELSYEVSGTLLQDP